MPRSGGLVGEGGFGRRLLEAGVQRTLGVDLHEQETLRGRLVEAVQDVRMLDRLNRRLGWLALHAVGRWAQGQDSSADDRASVAQRIRDVAKRDSQMLYAVRLRNAFCFGTGVAEPRAPDEEVQALLSDTWDARPNRAELTGAAAQWRAGKDLWETSNVYFVVFADGLDGRVLLGSLQHDQVRDVVRDPKVWRRVLYYVVKEFAYEWDYAENRPKPNPKERSVYYEAHEGMAELREEIEKGRTDLPEPPPSERLRPGQVLHVSINRSKEQAFGEPEMRTNLRWASSFNDLLAGQVEKAKAAQQYLMKVTAGGARTDQQLQDVAMRAVGRRSPLANAAIDGIDPAGDKEPDAGGRPGSQWWGNEALKAEPFNLESGASSARQDMQSASQAFASGTNFPGHYFFGDPGSLAGSMAVELPVLKLTEVDQKVWRDVLAALCDVRIARAIEVGLLTERRPPTDEEIGAGVELGDDGLVERDLSYELKMPDPLRRNLPELMQLVTDTAATFDPSGASEPLNRALLGYVLSEVLDFSDAPALLDRVFARQEEDLGGGAPAPGGEPATSVGPDGRRHTSANPYGARRQSEPVVEAALRQLWQRMGAVLAREADHDDEFARLVEAVASANGGGA